MAKLTAREMNAHARELAEFLSAGRSLNLQALDAAATRRRLARLEYFVSLLAAVVAFDAVLRLIAVL